jgi:hypothetical protein
MSEAMTSVQTAVQTALNVKEALPIPQTENLPEVLTASEKAVAFLNDANSEMGKATEYAKDAVFNAAAECESFSQWQMTVNEWRKGHKGKDATPIDKTLNAYVATITMAWKERVERAGTVRKAFQTIQRLADTDTADKYLGLKMRADGDGFLDPRSPDYKTARDFWKDVEKVKEAEKAASKMQAAKIATDNRAAAAAGNPAATASGKVRQTGDLGKIDRGAVQNALNAIITALHGNLDRLEHDKDYRDMILGALRACEEEISVLIPQSLKDQREANS